MGLSPPNAEELRRHGAVPDHASFLSRCFHLHRFSVGTTYEGGTGGKHARDIHTTRPFKGQLQIAIIYHYYKTRFKKRPHTYPSIERLEILGTTSSCRPGTATHSKCHFLSPQDSCSFSDLTCTPATPKDFSMMFCSSVALTVGDIPVQDKQVNADST